MFKKCIIYFSQSTLSIFYSKLYKQADWVPNFLHTHKGTDGRIKSLNDATESSTNISFSFDWDIPYSHEGWRGRVRASAGVAAKLNNDEVKDFDEKFKVELEKHFPQKTLYVPHRIFAVIGTKKGCGPIRMTG